MMCLFRTKPLAKQIVDILSIGPLGKKSILRLTGAAIEVWEMGRVFFIPHFTGHVIIYPCWD